MFGLFVSLNHLHYTKWFRFTILKDVLQNSFVLLWDKHTVTAFLPSNSVIESFSSLCTSIIYFVVLIHYCLFFLIMIFMQWYDHLDLNINVLVKWESPQCRCCILPVSQGALALVSVSLIPAVQRQSGCQIDEIPVAFKGAESISCFDALPRLTA